MTWALVFSTRRVILMRLLSEKYSTMCSCCINASMPHALLHIFSFVKKENCVCDPGCRLLITIAGDASDVTRGKPK